MKCDKVGRIKTITGATPADSWTYGYDDLGWLTSAANADDASLSETYIYAANGNLISRTRIGAYTYPSLTAIGPHAVQAAAAKR